MREFRSWKVDDRTGYVICAWCADICYTGSTVLMAIEGDFYCSHNCADKSVATDTGKTRTDYAPEGEE